MYSKVEALTSDTLSSLNWLIRKAKKMHKTFIVISATLTNRLGLPISNNVAWTLEKSVYYLCWHNMTWYGYVSNMPTIGHEPNRVSEKRREHYITGWLEVTLDTFLICCEMKMSNYVKVCMSNKLYHIEISI